MTIQETVELMQKGFKVRRASWGSEGYISMVQYGNYQTMVDQSEWPYSISCLHTLLADDWEIYD